MDDKEKKSGEQITMDEILEVVDKTEFDKDEFPDESNNK